MRDHLAEAMARRKFEAGFRTRYRPLAKLSTEELAAKANLALMEIDEHERAVLYSIREVGDTLREAKRRVGHGPWTQWLVDNFDGSVETARNYMRVAEHWVEHVHPALMADSLLSYRGAMRLIRMAVANTPRAEKCGRPKTFVELAKESLRDSINQRLNMLDHNVIILMQKHWEAVEFAVYKTIARKERRAGQNGNAVTVPPPAAANHTDDTDDAWNNGPDEPPAADEKTTESGNAIVLACRPPLLLAEVIDDDPGIDCEEFAPGRFAVLFEQPLEDE